MLKHVHASEKRSCCPSRQKESGQFAQRGFPRRAEDNELDAGSQARPHFDLNFASVPLFPPMQAKLAGGRGGEKQEANAASSEEWFDEDVEAAEPVQEKPEPNRTGMPDRLKAGIEALSGIDMSDVRVHANSPKPAMLNALAYTQGNQIHIAPGQGRHLAHEAWHAVQQAQGRVRATKQMKGLRVNDDPLLEIEAGRMGSKAMYPILEARKSNQPLSHHEPNVRVTPIIQRLIWVWSATEQTWSPKGEATSSTSVAPKHRGTFDGQEYDDQAERDKGPFVELPLGVKEKSTRDKTGLLGTALANDEEMRKKKAERNRPPSREAQYLYHATTYGNLRTIVQDGLDPNLGGSDRGASKLAEGELKTKSFEGSRGFVHGATQSEVALHYANKYDKRENQKPERIISGFSVMLRFVVGDAKSWTEDTEDSRGNYKTRQRISPNDIQFLDAVNGWTPLSQIVDLNALLSKDNSGDSSPNSVAATEHATSIPVNAVCESAIKSFLKYVGDRLSGKELPDTPTLVGLLKDWKQFYPGENLDHFSRYANEIGEAFCQEKFPIKNGDVDGFISGKELWDQAV